MRYKAIVEYDGSNYYGFQIQPNLCTIQQTIEESLTNIYKTEIKIVASSRTDALVHAKHQVFHYDSDIIIPITRLANIINNQLPNDIYVKDIKEVDESFHARYDVVKKEYRYIISIGEFDVFKQRYTTYVSDSLDLDLIKQAMVYFIGKHDFRSFAKATDKENTIREIESFTMTHDDQTIVFSIIGNGFLHHMVRIIVGTLLEVGRGNLSSKQIKSILDEKNRVYAPFIAPPQGLYLWDVIYKQDK